MKSRSHRLPSNEPPDDWGDGSWTVDCVCGVNFDDGEEMVNCDECGVWVHTRCSRFVKGETSFACDKCKSKKNGNDNEETEVAQLLVELPTKTITMDNAYPPSAPPRSSSFRLWTEIPIEERVHVQGVPGGDPSLFRGLSSVFTSELWKCSGYVPKKFNFQYREFPCWNEKEKQEPVPKIDEENENPVDRGADALFSLSKEIVSASPVEMLVGLRGSVEGGSREKKPPKKEGKKRETNDSSVRHVDNGEERETNHLRTFGTHLGKRKKDNLRSKDLSGKKKARSASKEVDGKKRVSTTSIAVKELDSFKAGGSKVVETTFHDSMNRKKAKPSDPGPDGYFDVNNNGSKGNLAVNVDYPEDSSKKVKLQDGLVADVQNIDDLVKKAKPRDNLTTNTEDSSKKVKGKISLEPLPYHADEFSKKGKSKDKLLAKSHHTEDFVKKVKLKDSYAANAYHGENISREAWKNSSLVEIVVKSENDHQAPTRTGNSSETVAVEVSLLEEPDGVSAIKKIKDLKMGVEGLDNHNDEKHDVGSGGLIGNSCTALSPPTLMPLVGDLRNVMTVVRDCQVQDSVESTLLGSLRSDLKVNTGANDDQPKEMSIPLSSPNLEEKVESTRQLGREEKFSVSEHPFEDHQVHETVLSNEDAFTDSRILDSCEENNTTEGMIPISAEPCQNTEVIVSVGTLSVQDSCSEPKHLKIEEPLKAVGINSAPPSPLSQRKVVLGFGKSPSSVVMSKSEVSGSCKPPGRPASPSTLRPIHFTKRVKANLSADIKKDHTVRDSHETTRIIPKEVLKGISQNSISKQTSPDSKELVNFPSPKALTTQNGMDSSGPIESSSTLQPQIVSHVQNKATSSGFSEKGERFNQPASHLSSKVTHSSPMLPPAPVKSTLSDEELALLLHQELNSSPRVPRVPRVRHAGNTPQSAPPTATSMLTKRTSSSGVKDHISVSRRKSREEASKDAPRNSLELVDEPKKIARALSSHDLRRQEHIITADGSSKKETFGGFFEVGHSAKKNATFASTITSSQSPSTETTDHNLSSLHNSPRDTCDADAGGITGPATRTLPGLLDEIMSKGKRMTYEELCNAVLPHWNNLRKHNGERYAYSSHSQAVLDCLRNRNEWAQLVDRGPKTNAGRKKRKPESEPPLVEQEENDRENEYGKMRTTKELPGKNFEAHPEDFPRGKRNARKRRRLALQGRGISDVRKRQKSNAVTDDELGQFSNSSDNDGIFSEDSQGATTRAIGSEASSSFDEAASL